MKCDKAFNRYLSLDKNERVPLAVTLHLLVCPVCRTCVRKMTEAERRLAAPLAIAPAGTAIPTDPILAAALERISSSGFAYTKLEPGDHSVSFVKWSIAGFALAAGFAILPFSFMGHWSHDIFGTAFSVPLYLLCGVAVTAYCGMFIGTNIDFFVKKFGLEAVPSR